VTGTQFLEDLAAQIGDENMARWTNTELLSKLNECRREMRTNHREAFCVSSVVTGGGSDLVAAGTLDVDDGYATALLSLVAYRLLSEDHEDANNRQMAEHHFSRYRLLTGEG